MKRCKKYREYISARADGELSAAELAELEEHLGSCAVCAAFAARLESTETLLGSLSAKAPAGFAARVSAAAQKREEIRPKSIPLWQSLALKGLGTAAVLCLVLAAALFSGKFDGSEKTGKAPPEGLSSMPTLAPGGNYESSDSDGASVTTDMPDAPDRGTLAEISAVVRGIVLSKSEERKDGAAYSAVKIEVLKSFFSREGMSGDETVVYHCPASEDSSAVGDEIIVFLSDLPDREGEIYTPTDPVFLYIRVNGETCFAGNFMRLADNIGSGTPLETDEETARYPLAAVEQKIGEFIEQYVK